MRKEMLENNSQNTISWFEQYYCILECCGSRFLVQPENGFK